MFNLHNTNQTIRFKYLIICVKCVLVCVYKLIPHVEFWSNFTQIIVRIRHHLSNSTAEAARANYARLCAGWQTTAILRIGNKQ